MRSRKYNKSKKLAFVSNGSKSELPEVTVKFL